MSIARKEVVQPREVAQPREVVQPVEVDDNVPILYARADVKDIHVGETRHNHTKRKGDIRLSVHCADCYPFLSQPKFASDFSGDPTDEKIRTAKEKSDAKQAKELASSRLNSLTEQVIEQGSHEDLAAMRAELAELRALLNTQKKS